MKQDSRPYIVQILAVVVGFVFGEFVFIPQIACLALLCEGEYLPCHLLILLLQFYA